MWRRGAVRRKTMRGGGTMRVGLLLGAALLLGLGAGALSKQGPRQLRRTA
jgi:hypothetical protein